VLVFNYEVKKGHIKSIVGYFISLTRAVQTDDLTIPREALVNAPPTSEAIAAGKEQQHRQDLWSHFIWLQDNATRENVDIKSFAKKMGMEEAYDMYHEINKKPSTQISLAS